MRAVTLLGIAGLALAAACQDPIAPEAPVADEIAAPAFAVGQQTGPANRCYGEVIAGIASTWPYAHVDREAFAPPKGAVAKWIEEIGEPFFGITSVRQLQQLFCDIPI